MDQQLVLSADVPQAKLVAVAHEEATSLVYLVLLDADGAPMSMVKLAPEVALRISEDLNLETGKALVRARRRMG